MPGRFFRQRFRILPVEKGKDVSIPSMPGRFFRRCCDQDRPRDLQFQSLRCQGASSGRIPPNAPLSDANGVSIPSMPGRFFRLDCAGDDEIVVHRFNPFDARALLQALNNTGTTVARTCFNPFDARALLQAPSKQLRQTVLQGGFNPFDARALLQARVGPRTGSSARRVSIPSMPGRFFRQFGALDWNGVSMAVSIPSMPGRFFRRVPSSETCPYIGCVSIPSMPGRFFRRRRPPRLRPPR
mgnify:CR=1 FL=1